MHIVKKYFAVVKGLSSDNPTILGGFIHQPVPNKPGLERAQRFQAVKKYGDGIAVECTAVVYDWIRLGQGDAGQHLVFDGKMLDWSDDMTKTLVPNV